MEVSYELKSAIDRFLTLLHRYDWKSPGYFKAHEMKFAYRARKNYYWYPAKKYIWLSVPMSLNLMIVGNGELYICRPWRRPGIHIGNIYKMLDKKDWGKSIERHHVKKRQGMGMRYESAVVQYDDIYVINSESPRACEVCRRKEPDFRIIKTKIGLRCQYCKGGDTRHINLIRALGGVPTFNGKPI